MKKGVTILIALACITPAAFAEPIGKAPVTADMAAMQQAEMAWEHAMQTHKVDGVVSVMTNDAISLPPNHEMIRGKKAIEAFYRDAFKDKAFAVRLEPSDISRSGDLAYTLGTFYRQRTGADGKTATQHGKYVWVWQRQPDNSWSVVVDIWNEDPGKPAASK